MRPSRAVLILSRRPWLAAAAFALLSLANCSRFLEGSGIWVLDAMPSDSAQVDVTDSITVTIDYEYSSEYDKGSVVLAMEFLCTEHAVHESYFLDSLQSREAIIDISFALSEYPDVCDYDNFPGLRALRFKLILGTDGESARVVRTPLLYYFLSNPP